MTKTKEKVIEQLKKDKDFIIDAKKTLQKVFRTKIENFVQNRNFYLKTKILSKLNI